MSDSVVGDIWDDASVVNGSDQVMLQILPIRIFTYKKNTKVW